MQQQVGSHSKPEKGEQSGKLMTCQGMMDRIAELEAENKKLKSRLSGFEPHKQRVLRAPNPDKVKELFRVYRSRKFALKVCYLGFTYDGMAYQQDSDTNSVEAYIFKALATLSLIESHTPGDDYTRAGRTDKGVSAMGNVIALRMRSNQKLSDEIIPTKLQDTKKIDYCPMMNAILPQDIRILACEQVDDEFNARYWCTKRSYKYFFCRNSLDLQAMRSGLSYFEGTHNFINFCKMNLTNTVNFQRTIFSATLHKCNAVNQVFQTDANQVYYFHFVGNSFLWHQIRFMSAVLFMIGSGQEKPQLVRSLLDTQQYNSKPNYSMAPEYPLILEDCEYPQVTLTPDLPTVASFHATFNQIVMRKSVEKTLAINCIIMAQRDLFESSKVTEECFLEELRRRQNRKRCSHRTLQMHKSSGRSLQQAVESLKGKKLQIFQKKQQKQLEYQSKLKQLGSKAAQLGSKAAQLEDQSKQRQLNQQPQLRPGKQEDSVEHNGKDSQV